MSTDYAVKERDAESPDLRRRANRWRVVAILAVVVAVVAATVAAVVVIRRDNGSTPVPSPSASAPASPSPSSSPSASATVVVPDVPIAAAWPLTTTREVAAWRADPSAYPYLATPSGTAAAFATTFLGITDATVRRVPSGAYEVTRPDPNGTPFVVTRVIVEAVDGRAPYVVSYATKAEELDVAVPVQDARITSPLRARGTYRAVDPSIRVEVFGSGSAAGVLLGSATATYSPAGWAATVGYRVPARKTGVVVVTNGSLFDPGITAAWVVPVVFGR